ncbi:MarR family transcriptional regulator [Hamadaea sp. NPDC050747]|uniref:MarR family winged helix-turn-helix transcriptional regulator n=1 Tax=Hamadaea sp. NPDC050747 TaxID=3155789 RepID=UPI0033D5513B
MGNELTLDNQVCFALYSASRAVTAVYRPILEPLGLTYPQYLVLLVLWENDPVTVKHLGEELMLDSGTLSPLLKRMIAAGLVTKERSSADERSVLVRLTPAGRDLRDRAAGVPAQVAAATGLTPARLRELRTTLREIAGAAQATAAGAD